MSTPSLRSGQWNQGDEICICKVFTLSTVVWHGYLISFRYSEWLVFEGISVDEQGKQHYLDATIAYKMAVLNCIHYLSQVSAALLGYKRHHTCLPHLVTVISLDIPRNRCIFSCRAALAREESVALSMCQTPSVLLQCLSRFLIVMWPRQRILSTLPRESTLSRRTAAFQLRVVLCPLTPDLASDEESHNG